MELRRYWEIIWRRKWVLIYALLLLPLFTYILLKIITPIYKSEAKLVFRASTLPQIFLKDVPNNLGTFNFIKPDNAMGSIEQLLPSNMVAFTNRFEHREIVINLFGKLISTGKILRSILLGLSYIATAIATALKEHEIFAFDPNTSNVLPPSFFMTVS